LFDERGVEMDILLQLFSQLVYVVLVMMVLVYYFRGGREEVTFLFIGLVQLLDAVSSGLPVNWYFIAVVMLWYSRRDSHFVAWKAYKKINSPTP
jgi:hypothetical protein